MLYNKNNLIVHEIASKDSYRQELAAVYFKKDRTVATDSYCLIEVRNPEEMQSADEYPVIEGKYIEPDFIVPTGCVKKALKNLSESKDLPILNNVVFLEVEEGKIKIASTNLEQADIVVGKKVEGNYPNYQEVIPKGEQMKVVLDKKRLKRIVDTLSKMDTLDELELFIGGDKSPVLIKTKSKQNQEITGLIMPKRQ